MNLYERYILPHALTCAYRTKPICRQRKKIVPRAHGRVLELGMGPGLNLPFYDATRVSEVIGVDPSNQLLKKAEVVAREVAFPVRCLSTTAEQMEMPNASIDTLLVTFTLCTIPDAVSAMAVCRRVLKPDVDVLFCEHGLAPDAGVAKWQNRLNPVWKALAGGCNLNRPIPSLLDKAGYRIDEMETMYLPSTPRFAGFSYWGRAHPI
ncbi:MAG: class I SAM-dependent methyltransferase [Hyphomonadaceae bacterium]